MRRCWGSRQTLAVSRQPSDKKSFNTKTRRFGAHDEVRANQDPFDGCLTTMPQPTSLYHRVYSVIRRIPRGRVSTYGRIAELVGCGARQVGYAMAALPDGTAVPWHRVINARGGISIPGGTGITQRLRLESEGVRFSQRGTVDLTTRGWPRGQSGPRRPTPSKRLSRPDRSRTG